MVRIGYDHFPLSARYVQALGMEFLGMTGKFHQCWGEFGGFKHSNALRYEVSLAAANGAKSSIGDQLHPTGEMDMATYKLIGEAYKKLEEKEEWLDRVDQVVDIAFLSYESYTGMFGTGQIGKSNKTDSGVARILMEGHYLFDVIDEESELERYKVIILPDFERITSNLKEKLDVFVQKGGKLLATGKSGLYEDRDVFAFDFGADYVGESSYNPNYFRPLFSMEGIYDSSYIMYSQGEVIVPTSGKIWGRQESPYFNRDAEHFCSHKHTPNSWEIAGPGIVEGNAGIYIGWQVFTEYAEKGSLILKRIVQYALDKLLIDNKTLTTNLGAQGITTLMEQKKEKRYINHLLYAVPVKRGSNVEVIEDIIPVYNINVELKLTKEIKRVYLAPQNKEIPFTQNGDTIRYTVNVVECHQMIVLEY